MNKSDLLTEKQRRYWADYFKQRGMKVVFWSALAEAEKIKNGAEEGEEETIEGAEEEDDEEEEEKDTCEEEEDSIDEDNPDDDETDDCEDDDDEDEWETESEEEIVSALPTTSTKTSNTKKTTSNRKSSCSTSSSVDFVVENGVAGRISGLELNSDDPALASSRNRCELKMMRTSETERKTFPT